MEELTVDQIKIFLEESPLYETKEYLKSNTILFDLKINQVDGYCLTCERIRPFNKTGPPSYRAPGEQHGVANDFDFKIKTGETFYSFACVTCGEKHFFSIKQIAKKETIELLKFGEYPRKKIKRSPALQKFLIADSDNYEKAEVCLANKYGIASFAYMRRILEDNIHKLLDLLQSDIEETSQDKAILTAIGELKKGTPMSEKIEIAKKALPQHLTIDGINPLLRLYQTLSGGVHEYSEAECLDKAKTTKEALRYLVEELMKSKNHRIEFKRNIGSL